MIKSNTLISSAVLKNKLPLYWSLIKSLQTGLLLVTGLAGYLSIKCPVTSWKTVLVLAGSLFLAVSGSTILNMVYDRDIDAKMKRTAWRPLPSGKITVTEALVVGSLFSWFGVVWAAHISLIYGAVVFTGLFFDVVVYTIWLKRRTPWSIIWGGVSGGMPILAGRALATGQIDAVGLLLALAVLLWIPTHIMTFSIKYAADYKRAGVPVFPNTHSESFTRLIISLSTAGAVVVMLLATWLISPTIGCMRAALVLGGVLLVATVISWINNSAKLNFALFKMASLYMLGSMGLIMIGA